MILRRRIWRILMENKGRYIGILILIILGSYTFVVATGVGNNLEKLVSGFAEEYMQEDLSFSTDRPIADPDSLEGEAGAAIEAYQSFDVTLPGGQPLRLLSPCTKVNIPAVKSGRGLQNPGDILLDPYFSAAQGFNIGDSIEIGGRTFNVVGTMALPHYIYALKNIYDVLPPSGFGVGLISAEEFKSFPGTATVYSVRFAGRENLNAQAANLHSLLEDNGYALSDWVDAINNKRIRMPWASITGVKTMSVPMPSAMFLLCCLILGVMIWRMVRADGVVIGTLYAQGYRRKELTRHYMAIPLILAAIGGVAGTLMGLPCIKPAINAMVSYYNVPTNGIALSPLNAVTGVLMPVIFLGLAGFLVIHRELKKTAGELMKGDEKKTKVNILERSFRLERFKFSTKFKLREQLRSIPRLLFLLLGVTGASVLMLFGFTINHSMNVVFKGGMDEMYSFRWEYSFKEIQHGAIPEGAEPFNAIRCYPEGRESVEFYITGIAPDSSGITLRDTQSSELPKDQVNITRPLSQRLKLRPGDTISFVNKLDGSTYSLRIDGIADTYAGQFIYIPLSELNGMTGQAEDSYSGLFSMRELDINERLLSGVKDLQNLTSAMDDIALPMVTMVVFMTVIAGLMGAIIIFLVTSLMIEESHTTISLLKVFGYKKREVGKLILNSSTPAVIAGFCLGVPVMLISANAMYGYLGEMINLVLPIVVNPMYILISFVLIMLVYELTKMLCGRKLAGISMSEALKAGKE